MRELLEQITKDLEKAENGNKAASQRVRTGTVKLEKVAKVYRKESIVSEKRTKVKKPAAAKAVKGKAVAAKAAPKAAAKPAAKPAAKAKAKVAKATVKPRTMVVKRPTARIPVKKKK
ncbi:MAG: hypothetical protein K0S07_174 [Chlamydiales bacterium]|nr:hypothetical protein [Chlamydiales bacterium]